MFSRLIGNLKSKSSPTKDKQQSGDGVNDLPEGQSKPHYPYRRPIFFDLSEEIKKDFRSHEHRTILAMSDGTTDKLPSRAGYAECINGGKSEWNEDQSEAGMIKLYSPTSDGAQNDHNDHPITCPYFCVFDGHAGTGAALMAADHIKEHVQEKLQEVVDYLLTLKADDIFSNSSNHYDVTVDSLVKGAIEAAFLSTDDKIAEERKKFQRTGGCTAIMALVLWNRLYVAHAGDCRAVAYIGEDIVEMSREFTPETDAPRIQSLAHANPSVTHGIFSDNCYHQPLSKKDIGKRILYRPPLSAGWYAKTVTKEDVAAPPLVAGRGKWSRLMGVIGVTRGFGDHDLTVHSTDLSVKPLMTAMPEVRVLDLASQQLQEVDVLVMGCDGLWDFISNEDMKTVVRASLDRCMYINNELNYTTAAIDIVHHARGDNNGRGWKMTDGRDASFDDISAFVIPLIHLRQSEQTGNKISSGSEDAASGNDSNKCNGENSASASNGCNGENSASASKECKDENSLSESKDCKNENSVSDSNEYNNEKAVSDSKGENSVSENKECNGGNFVSENKECKDDNSVSENRACKDKNSVSESNECKDENSVPDNKECKDENSLSESK